ncbi:hypothetical protein ACHAW6_012947 [Cyclotella cf. meneghiniana]
MTRNSPSELTMCQQIQSEDSLQLPYSSSLGSNSTITKLSTMSSHQVYAVERDGFRRMSGEDEMMFTNPSPFQADDLNLTTVAPKPSPPASPGKMTKEVLKPVSLPQPFKI